MRQCITGTLRRHFTLIELLVVISIISVLISILMPSVIKAREVTRRAVCASNLSQVGKALQVYYDENDHVTPIGTWFNMFGRGNDTSDVLNPYLGRVEKIASCPSDVGQHMTNGNKSDNLFETLGTSYQNQRRQAFGASQFMSDNDDRITVMSFTDPSEKLVTADYVWHYNRPIVYPQNQWHSNTRRLNVLFVDGHVEFFHFPYASPGQPDPANGYY
ncbi:MAG: prepilin-type N-terminal cleavage/methylation domain-containing protein [Lentisphaerales bacterium]|nr:prepilin-type N-terminal cleavage/methylation domain-containing protein [Lentisphaerales bacterium]